MGDDQLSGSQFVAKRQTRQQVPWPRVLWPVLSWKTGHQPCKAQVTCQFCVGRAPACPQEDSKVEAGQARFPAGEGPPGMSEGTAVWRALEASEGQGVPGSPPQFDNEGADLQNTGCPSWGEATRSCASPRCRGPMCGYPKNQLSPAVPTLVAIYNFLITVTVRATAPLPDPRPALGLTPTGSPQATEQGAQGPRG